MQRCHITWHLKHRIENPPVPSIVAEIFEDEFGGIGEGVVAVVDGD